MAERRAACRQLTVVVEGEPVRIADPAFPPPRVSVWEARRHPWVAVPEGAEHLD